MLRLEHRMGGTWAQVVEAVWHAASPYRPESNGRNGDGISVGFRSFRAPTISQI